MTLTSLTRLSYDIASGAQISFVDDVAKNPSEGGITGRLAMRPIKREYMLTIDPSHSHEMINIVMAMRGGRYPFVMRDYADNYQLTDEVIPHTGTTALIGRTWAPSTGTLSVFERILYVDTQETQFVVKVNGAVPSPDTHTLTDFGKITIPGLTGGDVVTVTGQYLIPVCIMDFPASSVIRKTGTGTSFHKFSDMRLEQIFENELIALTS